MGSAVQQRWPAGRASGHPGMGRREGARGPRDAAGCGVRCCSRLPALATLQAGGSELSPSEGRSRRRSRSRRRGRGRPGPGGKSASGRGRSRAPTAARPAPVLPECAPRGAGLCALSSVQPAGPPGARRQQAGVGGLGPPPWSQGCPSGSPRGRGTAGREGVAGGGRSDCAFCCKTCLPGSRPYPAGKGQVRIPKPPLPHIAVPQGPLDPRPFLMGVHPVLPSCWVTHLRL